MARQLRVQFPGALYHVINRGNYRYDVVAARFNRFRSVSGHLFQGRYQALLIEDEEPLFRVANYIHLNPVRAHHVSGGHHE